MAEYKKMKLEDVFADIEKIMGADASDEPLSVQRCAVEPPGPLRVLPVQFPVR